MAASSHFSVCIYIILCNTYIYKYRGHGDLIAEVESAVSRRCPGLFLGGNYRGGVAFGDCVKNGMLSADDVSVYLMKNN